jgi:hypothetical protein
MRMGERRLVLETPEMHASAPMQRFIGREVSRPCKQWIHEVISSRREADRVILRTPDFVLLPDVETLKRRPSDALVVWGERRWRPRRPSFHWLAVATDTGLRTLRDLRGRHIPFLTRLYHQACQRIRADTGVEPEQVMAYIHYPPSVYQLHVHFKFPVSHTPPHDTFRVHPLASVLNNLHIDGDYYAKSLLQLPVYLNTELYAALCLEERFLAEARFEPVPFESKFESKFEPAFESAFESAFEPAFEPVPFEPGPFKPIEQAHPAQPVPTPQTVQNFPRNGYRLLLTNAECSPTTSPGSRPSTPDPPAATASGSATPATSP